MTEKIKAHCIKCGRDGEWDRLSYDPLNAVSVWSAHCNKCDDGDFDMWFYCDAEGRSIDCDGNIIEFPA